MHFLTYFSLIGLTALPLVTSVAIDLERRASAVSVTLSSVKSSVVKAVIKNTGSESLNLLKSGSFLDSAPVEKAVVSKDGAAVPFTGLLARTKTTDLTEDAFTALAAGQTLESTFDLASVSDLSAGGAFDVLSEGAFAVASAGSTDLSSERVTYKSNKLTIDVDGAAAARVAPAIKPLDRRTIVQSCSGSNDNALRAALPNVVSLANSAANAALNNNAKFVEYFDTTSQTAKDTVAARFRAVAREAGSTTSGATSYSCTDPYGYCSPNVLAYALPSQNFIANCPIFYSLPALTNQCHRQDQATTVLHEFTHTPGTYSPGTQDNGYGYAAATALSSNAAINNADSYALFANAIYVGC